MYKDIVLNYQINKSFVLSSGRRSDHYFDVKSLLLSNLSWNQIKDSVMSDLKSKFPEVYYVAGVGIGGSILALRLAESRSFEPLVIRDNVKTHGLLRQVEGKFHNGTARTVIVDDVCTTGKSFRKARKVLNEIGLKVLGNYVLLKRKESNFNCESFISMW